MFKVVELKFNAAEHKFNDVEHTFSDTKLSFHARRRFIVSEEIYLLVAVWHTLALMESRLFHWLA